MIYWFLPLLPIGTPMIADPAGSWSDDEWINRKNMRTYLCIVYMPDMNPVLYLGNSSCLHASVIWYIILVCLARYYDINSTVVPWSWKSPSWLDIQVFFFFFATCWTHGVSRGAHSYKCALLISGILEQTFTEYCCCNRLIFRTFTHISSCQLTSHGRSRGYPLWMVYSTV